MPAKKKPQADKPKEKSETALSPVALDPEVLPPDFKIEWWPVDRPIDYARNARLITDEAVEKTAASLKEFGWQQVIVVDKEGVIIAGHCRRRAAKKLGHEFVPVHVATKLTPAQVKAYRLADNRTGQEAKWHYELVAAELEELRDEFNYNLALTAFDEHEITPLLAADWHPQPPAEDTNEPGEPHGGDGPEMCTISVTREQHELIGSAIMTLRKRENDNSISDGRALELICASYLSGPDESLLNG